MRTKNHTKETIIAPDRTGVDKMARNIRWAMRIVAASLVFIFGWLKLKGIDFVPLAQDLPADILLKSSLALYYCCWVAGTAFDLDAQAAVYATAPNKGRIPLGGLGLICSVGFGFGLLCWIESFRAFFFALLAFWSLDWIGWRYLHAV